MDQELEERLRKMEERLLEIERSLDNLSHQLIIAFGLVPIVVTLIMLIILK